MKSRIANRGPLLTLVVQVSRKGLYVPASLLQQGLSMILGPSSSPSCSSRTPCSQKPQTQLQTQKPLLPHPHWLCPSSTAGSSQPCLSSSTSLPSDILAKQPQSLCHPAPHRQKPQILLFTGGQLFPFGWGRNSVSLGAPLP